MSPGSVLSPSTIFQTLLQNREAHAQITLILKDKPFNSVLYVISIKEAWDKLRVQYKGKGKQTIVYLIDELFSGMLSDKTLLKPQLNIIYQKAHILTSFQSLSNLLVIIAMVISLPSFHSVLCTFLCLQMTSSQWIILSCKSLLRRKHVETLACTCSQAIRSSSVKVKNQKGCQKEEEEIQLLQEAQSHEG